MAWDIISSETVQVEDTNPKVWRDAADVDINNGLARDAMEKLYKAKQYYGDARRYEGIADPFLESCAPIVVNTANLLSERGFYEKSINVVFDILGSGLSKYAVCSDLYKILAYNNKKLGVYIKYVWYMTLYFFYKIINWPFLPVILIVHLITLLFLHIVYLVSLNVFDPASVLHFLKNPPGGWNGPLGSIISIFQAAFYSLDRWIDLFDTKFINIIWRIFGTVILPCLLSPISGFIFLCKAIWGKNKMIRITYIWFALFIMFWISQILKM